MFSYLEIEFATKAGDYMSWIELIKQYKPYNEQEEKDKKIILQCINNFSGILTRDSEVAHITSSAFIINKTRDKALMIHHNIYNSWSWTGGHADGEGDLLSVAIREAKEETGVKTIHPVNKDILSLDVLPVVGHIKKGKYIAAHLHLSVSYLLEATEEEELIVKDDENSGVRWISIDEVNLYTSEPHMKKVYEKLIEKVKGVKY
jgi:8-oxo-dGTP pyrophosphatase MutT (NUDIX family)